MVYVGIYLCFNGFAGKKKKIWIAEIKKPGFNGGEYDKLIHFIFIKLFYYSSFFFGEIEYFFGDSGDHFFFTSG